MHKQNWNKRRIVIYKQKSLLGYNNILYIRGFNNELETVHFLNHSVFLKIVFLYCMKDQCKTFSITSQAMHFNFPVFAGSLLHLGYISHILNCLVKSPMFRIVFRKSPAFTYAITISHYDIIFYMHMQYIFTKNSYRREVLRSRFIADLKLLWNIIFLILH